MPITTSENVLDIVSENIGAILPTPPTYGTYEIQEANTILDDATLPFVFLDRPLIGTGDASTQLLSYTLELYFIGAIMELLEKQINIEATLLSLKILAVKFVNRLNADGRIESIGKYTLEERSNFLDLNASAVKLTLPIVIYNTGSVCLT